MINLKVLYRGLIRLWLQFLRYKIFAIDSCIAVIETKRITFISGGYPVSDQNYKLLEGLCIGWKIIQTFEVCLCYPFLDVQDHDWAEQKAQGKVLSICSKGWILVMPSLAVHQIDRYLTTVFVSPDERLGLNPYARSHHFITITVFEWVE